MTGHNVGDSLDDTFAALAEAAVPSTLTVMDAIDAMSETFTALKERAIEEKQSNDALYQFWQEVDNIIERAISEGEKGYKRAIYRIRELSKAVR